MLLDKDVRRLLDQISQPHQIVKRRDHYFLHVPGHRPIIIAGNGKSGRRSVTATLHDLSKIIKQQRET